MGSAGDARGGRGGAARRILASWYDGASTSEGRGHLRSRLQGLLVPLLPLVLLGPRLALCGLESRLASSADDEFLARLPALRGGFQTLTPGGSRQAARRPACGPGATWPGGEACASDQRSGVVRRREPPPTVRDAQRSPGFCPTLCCGSPSKGDADVVMVRVSDPPGEITLADRWRLVLGVKGCGSARGELAASALDQLYGASAPRGPRSKRRPYRPGGTEAASPSAREWINEVKRSVRRGCLRGGAWAMRPLRDAPRSSSTSIPKR